MYHNKYTQYTVEDYAIIKGDIFIYLLVCKYKNEI